MNKIALRMLTIWAFETVILFLENENYNYRSQTKFGAR